MSAELKTRLHHAMVSGQYKDMTLVSISKLEKIPCQTLSDIKTKWNPKAKILQQPRSNKLKTFKSPKLSELEKELYKWFIDVRQKHVPLNGTIIRWKAKLIKDRMGVPETE